MRRVRLPCAAPLTKGFEMIACFVLSWLMVSFVSMILLKPVCVDPFEKVAIAFLCFVLSPIMILIGVSYYFLKED